MNAVLAIPEQRDSITGNGGEVAGGTPEAFRDFIRSETAKWAQMVQAAKIQPE